MNDADVSWSLNRRIGTISLDRPTVNAFRTQTFLDLEQAVDALESDAACSVIVLRSASPRIFSAGADVKELPLSPAADEERQRISRRVLARALNCRVPIVCAVPGPALGGACALAAACDIRLATTAATFGLPEISVGRCGGARYLMRLLPQGVVRSLYFTGRPIAAQDAWRLGLVQELLPDADALDGAAQALAAEIAAKSPTAVRLAKQSLDLAESQPSIETGYAIEQQFSLRLGGTADAAEAAAAFREKRAPRWSED